MPALNELDIARLIASGDLISPQHYQNVWLFALRISGTGVAYRQKLDEYVLRKPEGYLTEEFRLRCNGLPILWQHPPTDILTSEEFSKRVIGTMFLPYIEGDEVWGIAKIYNEEAAQRMQDEQLSTSPGVMATILLKGKIELDNGEQSTIVVEGAPVLADHLCVTSKGVWDRGGPPEGVRLDEAKGSTMTDETNKQGELLDKVLKGIDSLRSDMSTRMDAIEEEMKADKKRRDDAEEGKKKTDARKRADALKFSRRKDDDDDESYRKRHDAEEEGLKNALVEAGEAEQLAADSARRARKDAEEVEERAARKPIYQDSKLWDGSMSAAQARADEVYQTFGKQAPPPLAGETLRAYERRLLQPLLKYSPRWKSVDLVKIAIDSAAFDVVREQVFEDARADAGRTDLVEDEIRMVTKKHPITGLPIYEFVSSGGTFIGAKRADSPIFVGRLNPTPGSRLTLPTKISP